MFRLYFLISFFWEYCQWMRGGAVTLRAISKPLMKAASLVKVFERRVNWLNFNFYPLYLYILYYLLYLYILYYLVFLFFPFLISPRAYFPDIIFSSGSRPVERPVCLIGAPCFLFAPALSPRFTSDRLFWISSRILCPDLTTCWHVKRNKKASNTGESSRPDIPRKAVTCPSVLVLPRERGISLALVWW